MARIVFDLDGTLIDSAPDIHALANRVLAAEGVDPVTLDEVRGFVGRGTPTFVARMRAARAIPDGEQDRLHDALMAGYEDATELTRPYPGAVAALEVLTARGHALGICTNKPIHATRSILAALGMDRHFGAVLGGDSLPVRKPDPAPLHAAFDALGEGDRLYVGDSETDAETAEAAGVPFLLYTEGYRHSPIEALPHAAAFDDWSTFPDLAGSTLSAG